jgi:hypothetical protein
MAALPSIGHPFWRHPQGRKAADLPVAAEKVRVVTAEALGLTISGTLYRGGVDRLRTGTNSPAMTESATLATA